MNHHLSSSITRNSLEIIWVLENLLNWFLMNSVFRFLHWVGPRWKYEAMKIGVFCTLSEGKIKNFCP